MPVLLNESIVLVEITVLWAAKLFTYQLNQSISLKSYANVESPIIGVKSLFI